MSWICPGVVLDLSRICPGFVLDDLNDDNCKAKLDILDTFGDDGVEDLESHLDEPDDEKRLSGGDHSLQHNGTWSGQHRDSGIPDIRCTIPAYGFDCIEHVVAS